MSAVQLEPATPAEPGLTSAEAVRRLAQDDRTAQCGRAAATGCWILAAQLGNPLILSHRRRAAARLLGEGIEAVVILLIVALNAALGFAQEYRAERAVRALRRLVTRTARVRRDGVVREVPAADLVRATWWSPGRRPGPRGPPAGHGR
jgi:Ca2+-transporting ATPase